MSEHKIETGGEPANVTIIRESGGSGLGGMMIALVALVIIAVVAFWLINSSATSKVDPSDASISAAADKVGNAAQKVGNAAEDAVKKIN